MKKLWLYVGFIAKTAYYDRQKFSGDQLPFGDPWPQLSAPTAWPLQVGGARNVAE